MPKSGKKFRQTKKVAAAAIVTGIILSGSNVYANEVETELNNDVVDKIEEPASKEEVKEEVKEETKEEVKEEQKENKKEENDKAQKVEKEEAPTVNKEKEEVKEEKKEENKKEASQKDREQLAYAIEEMRIAINLLDTADLNNDSNYERLNVFYKTAVERIHGIEVSKDEQAHIDWIKEAANEIESKMYYINRVRHEVNRVNTVFETSRKDTLKNKQIVLDALGDSVEVGRNYVNSTTLNKAMNMYHELYANWDNDLEKALEQLNYAIEETREAVNVMENKDLTVKENYDRMVAFMQAALDRLEGLYVLEGLENYSEHMNNLKANLENVKETAKLAKEIREAMDKVINAFDNNLSRDEKIEALDALGTLVDENKYKINTWTSYTAMELYHKYYALLENNPVEPEEPNKPEGPGEPDDDTVNPEDPNEPELPGEPDDDNTVEPELPDDDTVNPENPNEPELPVKPDDNNNTVNPENPNKPQVPVSPNKPSTPGNSNINNTVKPGFNKPSNNKTTNNTTNNKSSNGNNPKTGDMSMLGYIGLGLSSIVGLTINRKRK
ncbi:hypothetical protein [Paraclostridium sordellii]|uniref:hypothetical protein n=1 Tax=Paraclostridium sordellii TaxID=1505 RepID=UPI0005E1A0BD|nr:hypothetical protein [Paeniclostridium sordellii]CEO13022.1 Beta antigen [[Clostridium] sordellii] [Paeniclostridium sordellii]CEP88027.1 Beta antigen [[Clostridium] sordellii] [Paeniclostridium sordellii]CEQ00925.1 Beta antigen [[Clostridium] sordellii] [Paeniclostridium sordellii]